MHRAFAVPTEDPAFRAEPVTPDDVAQWIEQARREAEGALTAIGARLGSLDAEARANAEFLLAHRDEIFRRIASHAPGEVAAVKTRVHGDYHLGQVLVAQHDFYIIDFEGEPRRSVEDRRQKHLPIRDVAGILRSLDYATWASLVRVVQDHPNRRELLQRQALSWRDQASTAFLAAYREAVNGCSSHPADEETARRVLLLFMIEKIFYEVQYEIANRPNWVGIPLSGAIAFLFPESRGGGNAA
jgi:maltose alpha-D-glucosyltransferase/alpha-amylase